jgi:hypothetical protein
MSDSQAENIVFMIIRGVVALAIVGVAFYCIGQGIHFFMLPRQEAEAIQVSILGMRLSASGMGSVIFGTGIALCFVALRTTPRRLEARRTTENIPPRPPDTGSPALDVATKPSQPEVRERTQPGPGWGQRIIDETVVTYARPGVIDETVITRVLPSERHENL